MKILKGFLSLIILVIVSLIVSIGGTSGLLGAFQAESGTVTDGETVIETPQFSSQKLQNDSLSFAKLESVMQVRELKDTLLIPEIVDMIDAFWDGDCKEWLVKHEKEVLQHSTFTVKGYRLINATDVTAFTDTQRILSDVEYFMLLYRVLMKEMGSSPVPFAKDGRTNIILVKKGASQFVAWANWFASPAMMQNGKNEWHFYITADGSFAPNSVLFLK